METIYELALILFLTTISGNSRDNLFLGNKNTASPTKIYTNLETFFSCGLKERYRLCEPAILSKC